LGKLGNAQRKCSFVKIEFHTTKFDALKTNYNSKVNARSISLYAQYCKVVDMGLHNDDLAHLVGGANAPDL